MATAFINGEMLRWAMLRANVTPDEVATSVKKSRETVESWILGESKPTFRQAQDLARRLRMPFGFLFLEAPPDDDLPVPDFRRVHGAPIAQSPSVDLRDVIADVLRKQQWFAEYQRDRLEAPLPFVGSFTLFDDPRDVAADMARRLRFDRQVRVESQRDAFLREFSRSAQDIGVLVMRSGVVVTNTHRPLNVREFRGFAISDPYAPAVFINSKDAHAAQVFTLAHELAHIWIGESGISNFGPETPVADLDHDETGEIEGFCDRVAGELLLPWERVLTTERSTETSLEHWIAELSRTYHVSTVMVARQLWEHDFIDRDTFFEFYERESSGWSTPGNSSAPGGGNPYLTAGVRNSRILSEAVFDSMRSSQTTVRDAARLLGVKPKNFERYSTEIGAG